MTATSDSPGKSIGSGIVPGVLVKRRREVEARLKRIEEGALSAASGIGFGKRIGEGTNIAVERLAEVSMHESLRAELRTLNRAVERMAAGEATACDSCGKEIGPQRLEALPWATHCVNCAV